MKMFRAFLLAAFCGLSFLPVFSQFSQRGYIPLDMDSISFEATWQLREGTFGIQAKVDTTAVSPGGWLMAPKLNLVDGNLMLSYKLKKSGAKTFFVISPFLQIEKEWIDAAPHTSYGDRGFVGLNAQNTRREIVWPNVMQKLRQRQGRIQVRMIIEIIEQATVYLKQEVPPSFTWSKAVPHVLAQAVGIYGIVEGRKRQNEAVRIYNEDYLTKVLEKNAASFLDQAINKNAEGEAFIWVGSLIMALDVICFGIQYSRHQGQLNAFNTYYKRKSMLAPFYSSTVLGQYYGLKLKVEF